MTLPALTNFPLVLEACGLIADGYTVRKACDKVGVGIGTFQRIVNEVPEMKELYFASEQRGYDNMAEILLEIDSNPLYGSSDTKQQKIMSDNIKWFLSRKRPEQYGDKVTVKHEVTADKAIIEALSRGNQRVRDNVIEGVFTEVLAATLPPQEAVYVVPKEEDDWRQFI